LNGKHIKSVDAPRPTTNYQYLFGLYAATYETSPVKIGFDNYRVREINLASTGNSLVTEYDVEAMPYVISGDFELEHLLPSADE
jgi:hypothetical protein